MKPTKQKTLPPIPASAAVEIKYRRKLQTLIDAMHRSIRREIMAEMRRNKPESAIAQDESLTEKTRRWLGDMTRRWLKKFDLIADDIAQRYIKDGFRYTEASMMGALKDAGFTVQFKFTNAAREGYGAVIQENIGLIKSIPEKYLQQVQGDVWRCVSQGYDLQALTKSLQKNYGATRKRAELIARDQTNKARAVIEQVRRQELGITEAIWQHSGAGKHPRPSHVKASGQKFDISKGMYLDGVWTLPGEQINCRCSSRSILPWAPKTN